MLLTYKDTKIFKSNYFSKFTFYKRKGILRLQSKNTGHWWKIAWVELPIQNMYRLYHRYPNQTDYHVQCHRRHPQALLKYIKEHDQYMLNRK